MDMDSSGAAPGEPESRTGAFGAGSSLGADSARYNALVPQRAMQTSVLQPAKPSMNAESDKDYARVLPGGYTLPTQNGSAENTYTQSIYMRMQGR